MKPYSQDNRQAQSPPSPWDWMLPLGTRLVVWGLLFAILYVLRSFSLLIFFTFVFAYVQTNLVDRLKRWVQNRLIRVVLVATGLLCVLIITGIFLVPRVKNQTELFFSQFSIYVNRVDQELFEMSDKYLLLKELLPELKQPSLPHLPGNKVDLQNSPSVSLFQQLVGPVEEADSLRTMNYAMDTIKGVSGKIAAIASAFLLALLFSFLIVLDLPKLSRSVADLEHTKLNFIYVEVADSIKNFSRVLGRALEAQLLIAILNSVLTAIGIYFLGLSKNMAFLAVIVFFCSFIPVVGVFISSVPICLIALQTVGLERMILAILLIIVIHLIEGYILNPRIYGSYMRINPVIVLIILTIGGKLFHIWGLLLGVPLCTYFFGHAIRNKKTPGLR